MALSLVAGDVNGAYCDETGREEIGDDKISRQEANTLVKGFES